MLITLYVFVFPFLAENWFIRFNPVLIAQVLNPNAELVIQTETPINNVNAEIETQTLASEINLRKCSKLYTVFMLLTH